MGPGVARCGLYFVTSRTATHREALALLCERLQELIRWVSVVLFANGCEALLALRPRFDDMTVSYAATPCWRATTLGLSTSNCQRGSAVATNRCSELWLAVTSTTSPRKVRLARAAVASAATAGGVDGALPSCSAIAAVCAGKGVDGW